jgi:predicted HTH transcriptional regulator
MPYNPFDKPIGEQLTATDLQALITREVKESYYVEYKSSKPDNKKIGHSIAALANTFGGWYLVGVAADKEQNVAKQVCGFNSADWPDPIATVRDIVKSHISPHPLFFHR